MYGQGCYAESHWLGKHWEKVTEKGLSWDAFCAEVAKLPPGQLWRHNQAGDLPGVGEALDADALLSLVLASRGKRGFTYTHKKAPAVLDTLEGMAHSSGFAVNISCDSLPEADRLRAERPALPLVVVIPDTEARDTFLTPAGNRVTVCPAQTTDDVACASCKLCSVATRRTIVAFRAHGTYAKKVSKLVQLGRGAGY
jgi:hypothetical protein